MKLNLENIITEGIYDPGILKAIFLAGGPASGKSWVVNKMFGVSGKTATDISSHYGLKLINSDIQFERILKNSDIDMSDLFNLSPEEFKKISMGSDSKRGKAKQIVGKQKKFFESGRLGLIIDGTGKDQNKIEKQKRSLEALGYDTAMIFVNTDLKTALERNSKRKRVLPDDLVEEMWKSVQRNLGKFQNTFDPFIIIDNSDTIQEDRDEDFSIKSANQVKKIEQFLNKPVENAIGKVWMNYRLKLKNKTRSER